MNTVTIKNLKSFDAIIQSTIIVTADENRWQEEMLQNMWCIGLSPKAEKSITATHFLNFIDQLLNVKRQQVKESKLKTSAVFYLWFDEQAAQLRFNILSGCDRKLPFGCIVELIDKPEEIVKDFIQSSYHQGIPWEELEAINANESDNWDDDEEQPYILKVFRTCL